MLRIIVQQKAEEPDPSTVPSSSKSLITFLHIYKMKKIYLGSGKLQNHFKMIRIKYNHPQEV